MRWALVTRWLLPSLLPLFPAIYLVVLAQGVLLVAALPDVPFWPGGMQRVIAYSISYGIFLWVLALVPAVVFLALVPAVGERIEPRWRALLTVGLAVTIGASALALLVALLTGGGFAAHFVLLAPIWILYGLLVQVPAGAPGRRAIRAALGGATLGALTLAIPFLGVGALLWAGLLIGDGRRVEAGWVLASAAVMPALLFATALAVVPPPPLAVALASFALAILGVGIGLIVLGRRRSDAGAEKELDGRAVEEEAQPRPRQGR